MPCGETHRQATEAARHRGELRARLEHVEAEEARECVTRAGRILEQRIRGDDEATRRGERRTVMQVAARAHEPFGGAVDVAAREAARPAECEPVEQRVARIALDHDDARTGHRAMNEREQVRVPARQPVDDRPIEGDVGGAQRREPTFPQGFARGGVEIAAIVLEARLAEVVGAGGRTDAIAQHGEAGLVGEQRGDALDATAGRAEQQHGRVRPRRLRRFGEGDVELRVRIGERGHRERCAALRLGEAAHRFGGFAGAIVQAAEIVPAQARLPFGEVLPVERVEHRARAVRVAFAQACAGAHEAHLGILARGEHDARVRLGGFEFAEVFGEQREAVAREQVGRVAVEPFLPHRRRLRQAPGEAEQVGARGTHVVVGRDRQAGVVGGDRLVDAAEPRERPGERSRGHRLRRIHSERGAVRGDGFVVAAVRTRDVGHADLRSDLEAGDAEQFAVLRIGIGAATGLEQQRAQPRPRLVQVRLDAQRVAERLFGERGRVAPRERLAEHELDHRVVRREVGGATEVAQRRLEVAAFEQQPTEAGQRVRLFAVAQRGAEVLLGDRLLAAHERELAEARVRAGEVRIERERRVEAATRRLVVALAEVQRGERELDAGVFGGEFVRTPQQRAAFGRVTELVAQHAEQVQRLDVVGLLGEPGAIPLLGLVETALAMLVDGVFEHACVVVQLRKARLRARRTADYAASGHARLSRFEPRTPPIVSRNQDLTTLLRARTPLLLVDSADENGVIEGFRHAIAQSLRPFWRWSITGGLERLDLDLDEDDDDATREAPDASLSLQAIKRTPVAGVYLLLDFQPYLRYPMTLRLLREILQRQDSAEHTLVLVGAGIELPEELAAVATRFEFALPDKEALAAMLREEAFRYSRDHDGRRVTVDADAARAIVRNLVGLALDDARRIARKLIYDDGAITAADLPELARAKHALLDRDGLLHFEYDTAQFARIGGLARLKQWITQRRAAFLGEKQTVKLDPPKGVLLLGVQGCGKSLAAKATAGGFGVPLVRLDFGSLYNKYHGETERNLREALKSAELLAPCVLWIDEIEKALSTSGDDDGVSRRVLGYLLTWMAERKAPVFLVATANEVQQLPAELLRKGRFDETFFVDLPDGPTRAEVFRLHLVQRGLDPATYDLAALAGASDGYSGAEIEQIVVAALYAAAAAKQDAPTQAQLLAECAATRPLSVLMAEKVAALRAWARGRTVSAD